MEYFKTSVRVNAAKRSLPRRQVVLAAALGNGLEFYDFTVYSFFASIIGRLFFPAGNELSSLMLSLATFGVGFVVRPLGSVLIGTYADRYGRKPALLFTVAMMALGTGLIGLAPTYEAIGFAAPCIVVLGRLLQGFAAGGEVGAVTTLLMEAGGQRRSGALVSWQMASQGGAALAGAAIAIALTNMLSPGQVVAWGWRIPFIIGLAIGPLGYLLRRHVDDTMPVHAAIDALINHRRRLPWAQIAAGAMTVVGATAAMYTLVFFLPSFLSMTLRLNGTATWASFIAGVVMLLGSPFAGRVADRYTHRKPLLLCSYAAVAILVVPAFYLIQLQQTTSVVIFVVTILIGFLTLAAPSGFVMLLEGFRPEVRATSFGIVYATSVTLFGGFAQFAVSGLWRVTGSFYAPAWYVSGCGLVGLIGIACFRARQSV